MMMRNDFSCARSLSGFLALRPRQTRPFLSTMTMTVPTLGVTVRDIQYIGSFGRGHRLWGRRWGVRGRGAIHLGSASRPPTQSTHTHTHTTGAFSDTPLTSNSRLLTDGIVAINTAVFVLQVAFPNQLHLTELGVNVHALVDEGEIWRLLTSVFLHGSVVHLLLNNISLHALGALTEWTAGRRRFVAIYLLSGIGGNVCSYMCSYAMTGGGSEEQIASLGASGAIFGLAGALLVFFSRNQVRVRAALGSMALRLCGSMAARPSLALSSEQPTRCCTGTRTFPTACSGGCSRLWC
jgi:membrane associated rhomboid family serine protease